MIVLLTYLPKGDSLNYHDGMKFSTKDKDNDLDDTGPFNGSCASQYSGAWWYNACHDSNLNGRYVHGADTQFAQGVIWEHWRGDYYSLKFTEMKFRPNNN